MSGLTKKHNKLLFHIFNKLFSLKHLSSFIPVLLVLYVLSLFSLIFLTTPQRYASAGPTPPPTPTLSTSVSSPNVNFQFSQSELNSSAFKNSSIYVTVDTNSETGATSYISSIDEDTNLNHTDPAVTEKISSITSPLLSSAFAQKSWGYHVIDGLNNTFKPVPKASTPDTISVTNSPSGSPYSIGIDFGVKSSPDLPSGNYSKQILFTTITNRIPTKATFKTGSDFNSAYKSISISSFKDPDQFKHSTTPPPNMTTATIVSTTDSERPIYLWYSSDDKTMYWWSDADIAYANEDSSNMFFGLNAYDGDSVTSLVDLKGINFSKTKNISYMFSISKTGCIKEINFDGFDTSNVEDMSYMFTNNCYNVSLPKQPEGLIANVSNFNTEKVKNMQSMFAGSRLKELDLSKWNTKNVTDMSGMFAGVYKLTTLDVSHFDTKNVTNMSGMFLGLTGLTDLDVSSFDTKNVTDMSYMFADVTGIASLNVSNFNTSNVTNMKFMFGDLRAVTTLDVSNFDTKNVTNMSGMFANMPNLTALNVSNFNTSNVTDMSYMFGVGYKAGSVCGDNGQTIAHLTTLDVSHFDTKNVTNMSGMFLGQSEIVNLSLANFNTSKIQSMDEMFCMMKKLQNLDLSSFNTSSVSSMNRMFKLAMVDPINSILDLSSFNTQFLTYAEEMFFNSKIKTIYVSTNFDSTKIYYANKLFNDNTNLVGGNGTVFSPSNPTDKTYARIDAPGTPGYFTQKP